MYQDLSMCWDWPVKKSRCQFANHVEGNFETHFWKFAEFLGRPEQGYRNCRGEDIRRGLIMSLTQSIVNFSKLSIDTSKQNMLEHVHLF